MTILALFGTLAAFAAVHAASSPPTVPVAAITQSLLESDMTRPAEVAPHGVPASYGWSRHPRVQDPRRASGFQAFTGWGQLYRCRGHALPGGAVELRHFRSYALPRGARAWRRTQSTSNLRGGSYPENFHGATRPGLIDVRNDRRTVVRLRRGFNFHFYPAGRAAIAVGQTRGVAVSFEARTRGPGCFTMSAGADYWQTPGAGRNAEAGIGRFKRVTPRWRVFTMTTTRSAAMQRELARGAARR